MSYIFNAKKNKLKVGLFIHYNNVTHKIVKQLSNTTFLLCDIDVYNDMIFKGYPFKMIPQIKKDIRELQGCEVW